MRAIDADALHKRIKAKNTSNAMMRVMKAECLAEIDDAPTIAPERKKGRWEMLPISINPPVYKCSVCGGHALQTVTGCLINRHLEANLTDFCPFCGADMRGEQDDR